VIAGYMYREDTKLSITEFKLSFLEEVRVTHCHTLTHPIFWCIVYATVYIEPAGELTI